MNFLIISVPYTITDLQATETRLYIPRGAKWKGDKNLHFSSLNSKKIQLKYKNKVRNRLFIDI